MKCFWKTLCVTVTDSSVFKKNVSKANAQCALGQAMIITDCICKKNGNTLARWSSIPTCISSVVSQSWQFKMWEVFLPHLLCVCVCWYNDLSVCPLSRRPGFNPTLNNTKISKNGSWCSLLNIQHYKVWIKGKWNNPGKE